MSTVASARPIVGDGPEDDGSRAEDASGRQPRPGPGHRVDRINDCGHPRPSVAAAPSTALATIQPVFTDSERPALAGSLTISIAGLIWLHGHIQMETCWSARPTRATPLLSSPSGVSYATRHGPAI